ncbi:DUF4097 domain-containing protein [bacterium]|nr:DUF4097 domain-containing protein [bacterium]
MRKSLKALLVLAVFVLIPPIADAREKTEKKTAKGGQVRTQTFSVNKGDSLQVSVESGDIWISAWEKNEVSITAEGIDPEDVDSLSMTQSGNVVRVRFSDSHGWSGYVRFDIQVPSQFDMNLRTSGGDIRLQGGLTGSINGATSGGDIRLGDVTGRLEMRTSGGDIYAGRIEGDAILHTSGGDIDVQSISSQVDLSTSGGDIRVGNVGKSLKASTAGGNITVGDVGGEATVSTAGGDIQVGKVSGSATMKTAGGDIVLNGASGVVMAKTAGGDLQLKNVTGSVQGETAGGDVHAEIRPSGSGSSRLSTAGGDVTLLIPENAKATIEARIRVRGNWKSSKEDYSIMSDFKSLKYETDEDVHEIRGTYVLNGGGEVINLDTVNGDIYIRKLQQ